jgi:hypothetical protein
VDTESGLYGSEELLLKICKNGSRKFNVFIQKLKDINPGN